MLLNMFDYQHCGNICGKVFKNGPSKICERQPLKKNEVTWSAKQTISLQIF